MESHFCSVRSLSLLTFYFFNCLIYYHFLLIFFNPLGWVLGDWVLGIWVSADLSPETDACHCAFHPSATPTFNALPPEPSWKATPQLWKPALVTEELDSVLVSVCVLLIYLQDLHVATWFFPPYDPEACYVGKVFCFRHAESGQALWNMRDFKWLSSSYLYRS